MKRKLIYISHPLRGNIEENRQSARRITAELSCWCTDLFIFVNPLDMFMGQSILIENDRLILSQAVEIMKRCDGVIFCDGWRKSRGCRMEHFAARKARLPIWIGHKSFIDGFHQDEKEYCDFLNGWLNAASKAMGFASVSDYLAYRVESRWKLTHCWKKDAN